MMSHSHSQRMSRYWFILSVMTVDLLQCRRELWRASLGDRAGAALRRSIASINRGNEVQECG